MGNGNEGGGAGDFALGAVKTIKAKGPLAGQKVKILKKLGPDSYHAEVVSDGDYKGDRLGVSPNQCA